MLLLLLLLIMKDFTHHWKAHGIGEGKGGACLRRLAECSIGKMKLSLVTAVDDVAQGEDCSPETHRSAVDCRHNHLGKVDQGVDENPEKVTMKKGLNSKSVFQL